MKNRNVVAVFILLSILSLIACGGGGGGGTPASLSYTGSTAPAVISQTNSAALAVDAVNGGLRGNSFTISASLTHDADTPDPNRLDAFSIAIVMQNAVSELVSNSENALDEGRAVYREEVEIPGPCGGIAAGDVNIDDRTGDFYGDLTFRNYCDSNVSLNGNVNFSGAIDLLFGEFLSVSMNFQYLKGNDPSGAYILDGSISMDFITASRFTLAMDMLLQDGSTKKVFWIHNYLLDIEDTGPYVMNISGRFYDPGYGYVTVSTQQDLIVGYYDRSPSSSVIIITGEIGSSGGQTSARLTCLPDDIFQIEADIDGDGAYNGAEDWFSGDLSWLDY